MMTCLTDTLLAGIPTQYISKEAYVPKSEDILSPNPYDGKYLIIHILSH
jgi:hypothetical protein